MFILEFLATVLIILLILVVFLLAIALAIPVGILYLLYRIIFGGFKNKKTNKKVNITKVKSKDVMSIINKSMNSDNVDSDELKKEIKELVGKAKSSSSKEEDDE